MTGSQQNTRGPHWNLERIESDLRGVRQRWRRATGRTQGLGRRDLPSEQALASVVSQLQGALFPMRLGPATLSEHSEDYYVGATLDQALNSLVEQAELELRFNARGAGPARDADYEHAARTRIGEFAARLPDLRAQLDKDVMAAYYGDPAAGSVDEVLLCYPGVSAMIHHRLAYTLYHLELPLLARIVGELAHSATGIDIHPGASIGPGFFIDHGTGVVIGETAVIGEGVRLYQAVTLGAKHFPADETGALEKGLPRHPVVEDNVVIYAGATLLGRITIGEGATIGGNVWLTRDVPAGSRITQANLKDESPNPSGPAEPG